MAPILTGKQLPTRRMRMRELAAVVRMRTSHCKGECVRRQYVGMSGWRRLSTSAGQRVDATIRYTP